MQVVLGQGHQLTAFEHLEVNLDGAQGDGLGGGLGVVGARVHHRFRTADFVGGVEAVEEHLPQAQVGLGVGQCLFIMVARAVDIGATGVGVVGALAPIAGHQVDSGVVTASGELHIFIGRQPAVLAGSNFRMLIHGVLHSLIK
ncbi:hypothetical protein D3C79_806190 [compost metagenome]